jgi:membrane protein DedA with SNARE-associated domain
VISWATDVIDAIGLIGVALLIALESVFPPIPSELVLLLTGFNVSTGRFDLLSAILAATVGSLLGAYILYFFGRWIGEERQEQFLAWSGKWLGLKRADVDKAFAWFARHGDVAVFIGRFVPIVRSLVSIPAGGERMNLAHFTVFTALGSLAWNAIWITIGWRLGDNWERAERWSELFELALLAVMAVGGIVWLVRRRQSARSEGV